MKWLGGLQADALEVQTTKVKKLQEDIEQPRGRLRTELEAELAQEAGALSGMQVAMNCPQPPSDVICDLICYDGACLETLHVLVVPDGFRGLMDNPMLGRSSEVI